MSSRVVALSIVAVLIISACSDDTSAPTTSISPTQTTTTTFAPTTTPTQPPAPTTTTTLPQSQPNPELEALAGIWTSQTIGSWTIRLEGFTIVGGGNPTNLVIPGTVDLIDGALVVRGVDLGTGGCDEAVGRYIATRDGDTLTIELVEDDCTRRGEILPGTYALATDS